MPRTGPKPGPRLPFAPLELRLYGTTLADLAEHAGVTREAVYRWRKEGLTFNAAEKLCFAIGHHPAEFWDEWITTE